MPILMVAGAGQRAIVASGTERSERQPELRA
jgi:hypothetical protein